MPDEKAIVKICAGALKAARPYVLDGRDNDEAMAAVLAQLDSALGLATNPNNEKQPSTERRGFENPRAGEH